MTPVITTTAYCGPAPVPDDLLYAWNADVVALALAAGLALAHLRWGRADLRRPLALSLAAILVLYLSPLCALTVALFSARVAHHVLLVAVVAPLLALAFPESARTRRRLPIEWLVGIHALAIWFWHAPEAYAVGIGAGAAYWAMQASLLGTGVAMWRRILSPRTETGPAMLALLATVVQMGMLGALLTFAGEPLYAAHAGTTLAFGLTPLDDQQLGGLIMWVPAALPYLAAALVLFAGRLDGEAGSARR